jgi:hypothetical protein
MVFKMFVTIQNTHNKVYTQESIMGKIKRKVKKKAGTKKKKTIRDKNRFSALEKRFFSRVKQEYHDFDYIDKLGDKDKSILNSFIEESLGARFNHDGKKIYKSKTKQREIFNENNSRQRDLYSLLKAQGRLMDVPTDRAIHEWQEKYENLNPEEQLLKKPDVIEETEVLTRREYERLKASGAYIPMEMLAFYDDLYPDKKSS